MGRRRAKLDGVWLWAAAYDDSNNERMRTKQSLRYQKLLKRNIAGVFPKIIYSCKELLTWSSNHHQMLTLNESLIYTHNLPVWNMQKGGFDITQKVS